MLHKSVQEFTNKLTKSESARVVQKKEIRDIENQLEKTISNLEKAKES